QLTTNQNTADSEDEDMAEASPAADDGGKEPVAGLSAASSCIRFSLAAPSTEEGGAPAPASSPFRPVYTHQSFEGECLPGWRPVPDAEDESREIYRRWGGTSPEGLHPSYRRCGEGGDGLDVRVTLAPSCGGCRVEVRAEKLQPEESEGTEPAPKRKKVSFGGEGLPPDDDAPKPQKMEIREIVRQLALGLPPIALVHVNGAARDEWTTDVGGSNGADNAENSEDCKGGAGVNALSQPVGRVLQTYRRKVKGESAEDAKFAMTVADGADPAVARYHNAIQPLARWFIETADGIDTTDASRGAWKVLYLFRCHDDSASSSPRWSLAGYITLLHVTSPFHKPRPGIIVRICQALILPPYHRAGHGSAMLQCIHDYADKYEKSEGSTSGMGIVEVNVEDPAPAFVALRDSVDYRRFLTTYCDGEGNAGNLDYLTKYNVTDKEYFLPIPEEDLLSVAGALRVTKRQAQIIHEIYKLDQLERAKQANGLGDGETIQRAETAYRLMVKRSLRSLRIEELGACSGNKEKQKELLAKWFDETLAHYRRLLAGKRS
ncbi:hypothetical protein ACHAXT_005634, partial [Thalassiosira profunda]